MSSLDRKAFSTIELLMALALMGLLALAAIGPDNSVFSGIGDEPLDETLRLAVREARYQAVNRGETLHLTWDDTTRRLVISDSLGTEVEHFQSDALGTHDSIQFLCIKQAESSEQAPTEDSVMEVPDLVFDADRSSTPFIAAISYSGEKTSIRYDAFSNLKVEGGK